MKKICFVTTTSVTLKTFIIEIAKLLHEEQNYQVWFICDQDDDFETNLPDYINYIPVRMKRGINFDALKVISQLKEIFVNEQFDIVQYSTPNASLYASIASRQANIPIRLYGQWGIRYVGMQGLKRELFKILEKVTCLFSTHIRAVSFKNLDFAVAEKLYKKNKARVLGQGGTIGVELEDYDIANKNIYNFNIRKKYLLEDKFVYGFVGRFSRDKGSNELIAAFKKVSEKFDVALLCIGDCEINQEIHSELYEWAQNSSNVIFTGSVPNNELNQYYAAMNCYVHPTYREGFGMVLQEAAAMMCCIITTDIPGASEVMENDISCLLVEPKNIKSLTQGMLYVINNEDKCIKLGENARKRVELYFDRRIMLRNQLEDYKDVMK